MNPEKFFELGEYGIPTVSTPAEVMIPSYIHVFQKTMKGVYGISEADKNELMSLVISDYWKSNQHYNDWYEAYFSGKDWGWDEYEQWRGILEKERVEFPMRFYVGIDWDKPPSFTDYAKSLTLKQIKSILDAHDIAYRKSGKKPELVGVFVENMLDFSRGEYIEYCRTIREKNGREFFKLLMYTIYFRANGHYEKQNIDRLGIDEFEIITHYDYLIPIIKKYAPKDAIPPFIPGDTTFLKPIVDFNKAPKKAKRRNLKNLIVVIFIALLGLLAIWLY